MVVNDLLDAYLHADVHVCGCRLNNLPGEHAFLGGQRLGSQTKEHRAIRDQHGVGVDHLRQHREHSVDESDIMCSAIDCVAKRGESTGPMEISGTCDLRRVLS